MATNRKRSQVYVIIFIAGILLILSPLSRLADTPSLILGFPAAYIYIFTVWAAVIILLFFASRNGEKSEA